MLCVFYSFCCYPFDLFIFSFVMSSFVLYLFIFYFSLLHPYVHVLWVLLYNNNITLWCFRWMWPGIYQRLCAIFTSLWTSLAALHPFSIWSPSASTGIIQDAFWLYYCFDLIDNRLIHVVLSWIIYSKTNCCSTCNRRPIYSRGSNRLIVSLSSQRAIAASTEAIIYTFFSYSTAPAAGKKSILWIQQKTKTTVDWASSSFVLLLIHHTAYPDPFAGPFIDDSDEEEEETEGNWKFLIDEHEPTKKGKKKPSTAASRHSSRITGAISQWQFDEWQSLSPLHAAALIYAMRACEHSSSSKGGK